MPYIGKEPEHGNYQLLDALTLPSGVFDGSRTVFNLTADGVAVYPTSPTTLIISLGGVLQEPNSSYTVSGNQITFTTAPATSTTFFGVSLGDTLDIGTPSDDSVDSQHYVDGSIDSAHIADDAVTYAKMQNLGTADRVLGSVSTGVIGEVQIVPDMLATNAVTNVKVATGIDAIKLADGTVNNAELQYINSLSSNAQTQLDAKLTSSTKIDDLTAGDDNTDLDSSTSRHGLLLKLGGGTTNFLRADGAWAAAGGGQSFTGDTTVTSGNFVVATAGNGIDFSAQTASSVASTVGDEILNHYEEGTFVPHVYDDDGFDAGVTYNNRLGRYTRIGNRVFFTVSWNPLSCTALTQGDNAFIGGLPFTSSNTAYGTVGGNTSYLRHGLSIGYVASLSLPSNASMIQARLDDNSSKIALQWTNTSSAWNHTQIKVQDLDGDWILDVSGHYEVA